MTAHTRLPEAWRRKYLTPAEQRIIELSAAGHHPKDVARTLNRSVSTVRNQLYSAMKKLGFTSRNELMATFHTASLQRPEPVEAMEYAI